MTIYDVDMRLVSGKKNMKGKRFSVKLHLVCIKMDQGLLEQIDELIIWHFYVSRAEFIREAIRQYMIRYPPMGNQYYHSVMDFSFPLTNQKNPKPKPSISFKLDLQSKRYLDNCSTADNRSQFLREICRWYLDRTFPLLEVIREYWITTE